MQRLLHVANITHQQTKLHGKLPNILHVQIKHIKKVISLSISKGHTSNDGGVPFLLKSWSLNRQSNFANKL